VAREVREDVVSPARAETIANTEMNRATTEASVATYAENEVAQVDWLAEADACPECEANAEASPYALSEAPKPPQHPNCRCALSPADELGKSVADDLGLTTEERAGVWSASTDELTPAQLAYRETAGHNNGG
jgi:SPP1 gp7 family putative phage head morphogenesis protein